MEFNEWRVLGEGKTAAILKVLTFSMQPNGRAGKSIFIKIAQI